MYIYLKLMSQLEELLSKQPYRDGQKLPSIRTLAKHFGCSISTIVKALEELEKRHLVYAMPKSGYYVVKGNQTAPSEANGVLNFAAAAPDPALFPYLDFQHCINKAIDTYQKDLFMYGTAKGMDSLVDIVCKQLASYQVFTPERNVFIVSGIQQALSLLAVMPFPNEKNKVLIEQPGYHLFIEYLETRRVPVIGIERHADGIDFDRLEELFRTEDIKFFYTMPRFHNPLGCSYSREDKKLLAKLAAKYDVYIIEDDYLADFEQDSKADPVFAYDGSSHVIYLKSYSKIIFPGLRIGVAVIPDSLAEPFRLYKKQNDIDSSMLSQAALEIYLRSGMFERHRSNIRDRYAVRAKLLDSALMQAASQRSGAFSYERSNQPIIHTHIVLDRTISVPQLIRHLRKESILVDTVDRDYLSYFQRTNLLKLNVTNVNEENITRGIERIGDLLAQSARK
ncbi:PLP-dependent aminotransferase family protein [Paenibacillus sp. LHD-38]|uniref:aminotransferase-like domain-containing protein n=1 Tax=Paenibacillus sp. LHD-38 TaxID=3072143 RepID=UPI00280FC8EB|nr:PLP-dependent aminotransferase family protein [Paenibacillus sp. LHD-38]MDQ8737868.1 PLP-dependent aminotransferase family protein [Paenibacillus sp. LHD-38]